MSSTPAWVSCLVLTALAALAACSSSADKSTDSQAEIDTAIAPEVQTEIGQVAEVASPTPPPFVAVTFNTGTGGAAPAEDNYGYNELQAGWCDDHYGNGLSWKPFVEMTRQWFAQVDPDVIVFQEIFYSGECPLVPEEAWVGFVCEDWNAGDPTVMQLLLPESYQLMCNPEKPDKCAAVHQRFGTFEGCDQAFCLEGMAGQKVEGCGSGVRIGKAVINLVGGSSVTLINVHGSSGFTEEDAHCRKKQFDQIFVDAGDGQPLANGEYNLIMGDFNTDPVIMAQSDVSAARILDFVGDNKPFHFVTEIGFDAPATYGVMNIDHVISDRFTGSCRHPGITPDVTPVMDAFFFDHIPAVCDLQLGI